MKLKMRNLVLVLALVTLVRSQHNVVRFGHNDINEILDTHNDLRRSVLNAANMRELTWNEGVALAASEWGSRCEYISPGNQWGQNMNYFYGKDYHNDAIDLFRSSFIAWSNETRESDFRRYRYCGQKSVCSYVQLIAADIREMGCAIVKCSKLEFQAPHGVERHSKLLVCFYTPWVDILQEQVFIPDTRCAACPPGTTCVDNLCSARFFDGKPKDLSKLGAPSVTIEGISGDRSTSGAIDDIAKETRESSSVSRDNIRETSGGTRGSRSKNREARRRDKEARRRERQRQRAGNSATDRVIGSHNTFRGRPETNSAAERVVVYTPNNRVVPFPGKADRRTIRKIERYEAKNEHDLDVRQEKLVHTLELVANNITVAKITGIEHGNSRKKRQVSYEQKVYQRRLEYQRYLDDYNRLMRERDERRRQYEEKLYRRELEIRRQKQNMAQELRERQRSNQLAQELRQANGRETHNNRDWYNQELRRRAEQRRHDEELRRRERRLRQERQRYEALALTQNTGDLTGEEQFYTISAHNLLRREVEAKDLAWSSYLERWAKYVIRCETEYPGPITCHTNFGKAGPGDDIYNVVYEWGTEGDDLQRPLTYGCRTPYDKSLCNHNTIVRDKTLTQMACASKQCGRQRQLTCIYSSG